jgi:hypothetical protein
LVAFSNLPNLSHGKVKQMGASVSTQFCPSHFLLLLLLSLLKTQKKEKIYKTKKRRKKSCK